MEPKKTTVIVTNTFVTVLTIITSETNAECWNMSVNRVRSLTLFYERST